GHRGRGREPAARLPRAHPAPPLRRAFVRGDRFDEEASPRHREEQTLPCAKFAKRRARALRGTPMKTEACERYLNDPEGNAAHLRECAQCAALFADQSLPLDGKRLVFDANALPLAPWEGASQESWPLIVAGTLAVFSLAVVMFLIAGVASI